jgi:acetyl esterase/lipase
MMDERGQREKGGSLMKKWFVPYMAIAILSAGCSGQEAPSAGSQTTAEARPASQSTASPSPSSAASNQKTEPKKVSRSQSNITRLGVVYEVPGMEQVRVKEDIPYKGEDHWRFAMDVYYPPALNEKDRLPAIIFIHGDGGTDNWKDARPFQSWGELTAASGMIAITFNHRFSDEGKSIRDAAGDIDDLLKYVRTHADSLGIDKDRLGIFALSYGNIIGLRTALRDKPDDIKAVASYYGRLDIRPVGKSLYPNDTEKEYSEFSAVTHLKQNPEKMMPLLVVKAGQDSSDLNETIDQFVKEAKARRIPLEYLEHPNGQHAFDILDDDETSREIIRQTIQFFQKNLLNR